MKDYFLRDGGKLKKIGIKREKDICDGHNLKSNNENISKIDSRFKI